MAKESNLTKTTDKRTMNILRHTLITKLMNTHYSSLPMSSNFKPKFQICQKYLSLVTLDRRTNGAVFSVGVI